MEYAYATTETEQELETLNYEMPTQTAVATRPRVKVFPARQAIDASNATEALAEKQQPVNQSRAMQFLLHRAELVARLPVPVIIAGENGTGKSRIVEYVHANSDRAEHALVEMNCRAVRENQQKRENK